MKKKIVPFLAAGVLIIVVLLFMVLSNIIEKYTPSKERQDLSEYYGLSSDEDVAIVFNHEVILSVSSRSTRVWPPMNSEKNTTATTGEILTAKIRNKWQNYDIRRSFPAV